MAGRLDVVTGAFGYSGRAITELLLAQGRRVATLTAHPGRPDPFDGRVKALPYNFEHPESLRRSLAGVDTLYNTYWIRFARGRATHDVAVRNSLTLIRAASEAGIRRIVHVSITNPEPGSVLPYFAGKARLEAAVRESGMSHATLRPAVLFGRGDVLINNIAWFLRHLPVFGIPGDGRYRLQPTHVDDFARLAVEAGAGSENVAIDAVGPETFSFEDLVWLLRRHTGGRAAVVHVSPWVARAASSVVGRAVGDVVLTPEELTGLMDGLLVSGQPSRCTTRLSEWVLANGPGLGRRYASEVARHYREEAA